MEIIFGSNNEHKVKEIKEKISKIDPTIIVKSLKEEGLDIDIDENGKTFKENAIIKAEGIYDIVKKPVIADDSGLEIDALNGEPGVYSNRFAGENATDDDKRKIILDRMKDVEDDKRTARFTCCICFIDEKGEKHIFQKSCEGRIAKEERGNNGFAMDPIFIYGNGNRTFAEFSPEEKNEVSHRALAVNEFLDYLKNNK